MARKPNYVSVTLVCGRCRETIFLPSDYADGLLSNLRTITRRANNDGDISLGHYFDNIAMLSAFETKYRILYGSEDEE